MSDAPIAAGASAPSSTASVNPGPASSIGPKLATAVPSATAGGVAGEKGEATSKKPEKPKVSVAVQNCIKRLENAKEGKSDLKMLLLCDVRITEYDVAQLTPVVKASTFLRSLSLFGSGITAAGARQLASALSSHESLTMLDLGNNALGPKGVEDVTNALLHNSTLLNIGMASTDMQDAGATHIAHVLRMNASLTEVYLNSNSITEVGARELAGSLMYNDASRLKNLFVFGNPLGEAGTQEFVKLRQEVPMAQERHPLGDEMAMAFVMGTHERLGEISAVRQLRGGSAGGPPAPHAKSGSSLPKRRSLPVHVAPVCVLCVCLYMHVLRLWCCGLARRIWPAALHYGQVCAAARGTRPAGMPNLEHTRACTVKLLTFGHVHSARAQERLSHARHPLCVTQNQRAHPCGACEPGRRAAAPTRCSRSSSSAARSETSSGVLWERASTNEAALDSDETCHKTIRYCQGHTPVFYGRGPRPMRRP